ncbi:MAG: hydrolase family protein [Nocardioidaceae bacterium]|nr:hydrolase family protein [Nocardioidaceae bacterium]
MSRPACQTCRVTQTDFDYSNLSGRPPGPVLTWASRLLAGVREVQATVVPYAEAWQAHNRAAVAADGPLWVTLGDSMAQGIGASAYDKGWAGQLAGLIDPSYRHVNLSVSGGRVEDLFERQVPAMQLLGTPALVTVIIGSNDLVSKRQRQLLPGRLATLVPLLPDGTVMATMPGGRPGALDFNRQLADADNIVVCDFQDRRMASWRGKLAADHFHPNDLGYAGMAALMAEAVLNGR